MIEEDSVKLKNLKFQSGIKVIGNTFIEVDEFTRFYYIKNIHYDSFEFIYVTMFSSNSFNNIYEDENTEVEILFTGIAYFDGVRHIHFGDKGYINYPNITDIIKGLEELKKLEIKYCPQI